MAFRIAIGSLAVLWMIVDKTPRSHLAIANNLLLKNDMPLQLIALISGAPWLRRGLLGQRKIFIFMFVVLYDLCFLGRTST